MSDEAALWRLEREFWLGGAEVYERSLAPGALMVLPPPAGVMDRDARIRSIREGARGSGVDFSARRPLSPASFGRGSTTSRRRRRTKRRSG